MIVDLLIHEIIYNNLDNKFLDKKYPTYTLHCSEAFYRSLLEHMNSIGFEIPTEVKNEKTLNLDEIENNKPNFTMLQIPPIGYLIVKRDMEQGYKIEKYEK